MMRVLPKVTAETLQDSAMLLAIDGPNDIMRDAFIAEQPYLSKTMNQYAAMSEILLQAPGVKEFMQIAIAAVYYNIRAQVQKECNVEKPLN